MSVIDHTLFINSGVSYSLYIVTLHPHKSALRSFSTSWRMFICTELSTTSLIYDPIYYSIKVKGIFYQIVFDHRVRPSIQVDSEFIYRQLPFQAMKILVSRHCKTSSRSSLLFIFPLLDLHKYWPQRVDWEILVFEFCAWQWQWCCNSQMRLLKFECVTVCDIVLLQFNCIIFSSVYNVSNLNSFSSRHFLLPQIRKLFNSLFVITHSIISAE